MALGMKGCGVKMGLWLGMLSNIRGYGWGGLVGMEGIWVGESDVTG